MNEEVAREFESNPGLQLTEEEFAEAQEGAMKLYYEASAKRVAIATTALATYYAENGLPANEEQQARTLELQCQQAFAKRFGTPYDVAEAAVKMGKKRPR